MGLGRRDTPVNLTKYSEFRNYLLKNIKEIIELSQGYGGLVRNQDVYPINMDVYNSSSVHSSTRMHNM